MLHLYSIPLRLTYIDECYLFSKTEAILQLVYIIRVIINNYNYILESINIIDFVLSKLFSRYITSIDLLLNEKKNKFRYFTSNCNFLFRKTFGYVTYLI